MGEAEEAGGDETVCTRSWRVSAVSEIRKEKSESSNGNEARDAPLQGGDEAEAELGVDGGGSWVCSSYVFVRLPSRAMMVLRLPTAV